MEFKLKTRVVMNSPDSTIRQPGPHLTPEQMRQYESRELAPDEVASVHKHLGACAQCRRILRGKLGQIPIPAEALAMPEPLHLGYEELVAYMDGTTAGHAARERAEAHLFLCSACSRELADLEHLEKQLSLPALAAVAAPSASKAVSGLSLRARMAKLFATPGLARQLGYGLAAIVTGIYVLLQAGIGGGPATGAPGAAHVFARGAQSPGLGLGGIVLVGAGLAYLLYVLFKKK